MELLKKQFAIDLGCPVSAFENNENLFVTANANNDMRYWTRNNGTIICHEGHIYCRTDKSELTKKLQETYQTTPADWFTEVKNMKKLRAILSELNYEIINASPFLIPCKQSEELIENEHFVYYSEEEIKQFKGDKRFSQSFCFSENDPDKVAIAYVEDGEILAMSGANKNGRHTWEIGIEIIGNHQGKGLATLLVRAITQKIIELGQGEILPIYGTQFTHTKSMNVAIRAGYKLGWTEIMIASSFTRI
ncbi:MAG TPA: GNAT family N-acetyltransferase [Candidatus Jeotgalibaca pullicola]|nr:GNAT family N-acetyltransferase [Candidatus Jeotgalibaca pullicola]